MSIATYLHSGSKLEALHTELAERITVSPEAQLNRLQAERDRLWRILRVTRESYEGTLNRFGDHSPATRNSLARLRVAYTNYDEANEAYYALLESL